MASMTSHYRHGFQIQSFSSPGYVSDCSKMTAGLCKIVLADADVVESMNCYWTNMTTADHSPYTMTISKSNSPYEIQYQTIHANYSFVV